MYTYMEIKAVANKVRNEPSANEATKQLAATLAILAERTMKLEERHRRDIERLEKVIKALQK